MPTDGPVPDLASRRPEPATDGPASSPAAVGNDIEGPLSMVKGLAAPLAFAVLGSAGVVWLVRRRRR